MWQNCSESCQFHIYTFSTTTTLSSTPPPPNTLPTNRYQMPSSPILLTPPGRLDALEPTAAITVQKVSEASRKAARVKNYENMSWQLKMRRMHKPCCIKHLINVISFSQGQGRSSLVLVLHPAAASVHLVVRRMSHLVVFCGRLLQKTQPHPSL